ncbi:MAG TPA: hypothetical protein EYP40_07535 [Chromatiales bacterium]|nr:hypothetical protein [Chromatiales bacterium]
MKIPDAVKVVRTALQDNPACELGILAAQRVTCVERGINSHKQDKELLALISDRGSWWYGYVLRVSPCFQANADGRWLAILVQSGVPVDGYTPTDVFHRARTAWFHLPERLPYYVQTPEDGSALCHSFEEALAALRRIIARFDVRKRIAWERDADGHLLDPEGGILDTRHEDLFKLLGSRHDNPS